MAPHDRLLTKTITVGLIFGVDGRMVEPATIRIKGALYLINGSNLLHLSSPTFTNLIPKDT